MQKNPDTDIDLQSTFIPANIFPNWTRASIVKDDQLQPHPCGVYPQKIPVDTLTGLAAIPYKEAEAIGYGKIDLLHVSIYDHFQSKAEIDELLKIEPDWGLLTIPSEQKKLFQLAKHGDVLDVVKPKNIEELADVLALIRPGKKQFLKLYQTHRDATRAILYSQDENGYSFKKSHAIGYGLVIWLQLHLLSAGIL